MKNYKDMFDYVNANTVNVAVQILPVAEGKDSYELVDEAINVIKKSGVKHVVTPFETVMEGNYDQLMSIVKDVQNACYSSGTQKAMCFVKIQSVLNEDVTIDDKIGKYK